MGGAKLSGGVSRSKFRINAIVDGKSFFLCLTRKKYLNGVCPIGQCLFLF